MAAHFRRCGLPIPEIHIVSEDKTYYLQEDLGDTLLFHAIETVSYTHLDVYKRQPTFLYQLLRA